MPGKNRATGEGTEQHLDTLSRVTPFNLLSRENLEKMYLRCEIKHFSPERVIFKQGESSHRVLYIVLQGKVQILTENKRGVITNTEERHPTEFFGETVFLTGESYPATAMAADDLTCLVIPHLVFEEVLASNQGVAESFTRMLTIRLKNVYQQMGREDSKKILYDEPLHKRVVEIMISPVATCLPGQGIKRTAQQMSRWDVSSVVVTAPNGKPVGIVTEKDLVTKVLSREEDEEEEEPHFVFQIMSQDLKSVKSSDFVYQALLIMVKHQVKHVVVEEKGQLMGIITMKELVKSRNWGTLSAVNTIEAQNDVESLAENIEEIDQVQQALLMERAYAREICEVVTEFYDRVTRKIINLSEEEMKQEGWGEPPVGYSFIQMGSAGRREQYSRTDQDNGIIFEDTGSTEENRQNQEYFLELGKKVVKGLETCGFKRCLGGVMAENSTWCRHLTEWMNTVKEWVDHLDPTHVRNMTIFLDFRRVYGRQDLSERLRREVSRLFQENPGVLYFLAKDDLNHRVPLSIFRQIITGKDGKLNLKTTTSVHLIDCIRIFSLREGLSETSTFQRIHYLQKRNVFNENFSEAIEEAFETLLMLRINNYLTRLRQGLEPDNNIYPSQLNKKEKAKLKEAMQVASRLQTLISQNIVMGM